VVVLQAVGTVSET